MCFCCSKDRPRARALSGQEKCPLLLLCSLIQSWIVQWWLPYWTCMITFESRDLEIFSIYISLSPLPWSIGLFIVYTSTSFHYSLSIITISASKLFIGRIASLNLQDYLVTLSRIESYKTMGTTKRFFPSSDVGITLQQLFRREKRLFLLNLKKETFSVCIIVD